ncbi:hypothetical protein KKG83_07545 [Candidatus Micrarchaeota archaeon]|nr:hypothetical protein [Candidatus Micrarchaeota archaeon]MBU2477294.1 hypothetical protein [Candidatus Micrarchaeota archaeon]
MSISINTNFVPFVMDLKDKRPVRMEVEVINRYDKPKKVNLEVIASNQVGFNKTCTQKEEFKLGLLNPGESKKIKLDVMPKNYTAKGEENISVIATEITVEESGYTYPSKKFRKNTSIKIK